MTQDEKSYYKDGWVDGASDQENEAELGHCIPEAVVSYTEGWESGQRSYLRMVKRIELKKAR